MNGQKFDNDKLRFDLIPPEIELWLAEILTYGAKKYTKSCPFGTLEETALWLKKNNLHNVIQIERSSAKECVEVAMKRIYVKQILNMLNDKEKMLVGGKKLTLKDLQNIENVEAVIQNVENVIHKPVEEAILEESLDYLLILLKHLEEYKKMLVVSVDETWMTLKPFILTITTLQENIEEYYVVSATTVLDSLTMTFNYLQKQFPTCKPLQNLKCEGANNWKKIETERYWAALRRHINAFQLGEENDQESGYHHLKHALTNLCFIAMNEVPRFDKDGNEMPPLSAFRQLREDYIKGHSVKK